MSWLTGGLAFAADGFLFHHRHSGAIHLYIQDGDRLTHDEGKIQLRGALDLDLFARGDIFSNRLRRALHALGGDFQIGE